MTLVEMRELSDEDLLRLSLKRNKRNNNYTDEAKKAQRIYQERKGGFQDKTTDLYLSKKDRSYYSEKYY